MTRYKTHPATATRETSNRHLSQKEILTGASFYIFNLILVVLFPTILSCLYHLDTSVYNFNGIFFSGFNLPLGILVSKTNTIGLCY